MKRALASLALAVMLTANFAMAADSAEITALKKKAEAGDTEAMWSLLAEGVLDDAEARKLCFKAAEMGHRSAQSQLGCAYRDGLWGVPRNPEEAIKWFRKSAEQGYVYGVIELGKMYLEGEGVGIDEDEALRWFRRAEALGGESDKLEIADILHGHALLIFDKPQPNDAARWFRLAAERGKQSSQAILGALYSAGTGVPKDDVEAVKWYRKAAEQGYASAQYGLGVCYSKGDGVPKDKLESVKWYRKAAEQGFASAQFNLGVCYSKGEGVIKDPVEAHAWWNVAGARGDEDAKKNLAIIENEMTKEQIAEATKLAKERFEKYKPK